MMLLVPIFTILGVLFHSTLAGNIGVGLGFGKSSTPYADALNVLKNQGIRAIKTYSINSDWLNQVEAVYGQGSVDITVAIPNADLWNMYNNQGFINGVLGQLQKHRKIIKFVAIGNEPFLGPNRAQAMPHLLNAFNRMVKLLSDNGLQNDIKVTIPFSSAVLTNTYPVDSTVFHPDIIGVMRSIVPVMQSTGSKFSINLYPYFAYIYTSSISLNFALGKDGSLFEAMLRGCQVALKKIGYSSLPIIVGETGWPSQGGPKDTNVATEQAYIQHMIDFSKSSNLADTIYIFEAFDESEKPGDESERHFGIGYENRQLKFNFNLGNSLNPCTQWGWRFYDYYDIVANDMGNQWAGNRNDCQQMCRNLPGCKGYSWYQNVCYFKSGYQTFKPNNEVYSALLC